MKKRFYFLFLAAALLFAACDRNPAWDGSKSKDKADKLAEETCKCLYTMMDEEPGWELTAIMKEVKAIRKSTKGDLQMAILETENPAVLKALLDEEAFSLKMDDCECMQPVQDGLLEQGVAFETMMERLDRHCLLGVFYN